MIMEREYRKGTIFLVSLMIIIITTLLILL
jgi:hypothetical protein